MNCPNAMHRINHFTRALAFGVAMLGTFGQSHAQPTTPPPAQKISNLPATDLNLSIQYYSRVLTDEGVVRESRYEETMLRREGHVWIARVLPKQSNNRNGHGSDGIAHDHNRKAGNQSTALNHATQPKQRHKHFNPVLIPRHLTLENGQMRLEYVDFVHKELITITPAEYENVGFDASWANAYYLLDPKFVATLPLSQRASSVPGASWYELERNGVFQRVLWDKQNMLALVIESGTRAGTVLNRIEAKKQTRLQTALPWQNLKGYAQKEYSDFLD